MNDKLHTLLNVLTEKNINNETIWLKTSGDNEFKIKLSKAHLTVSQWNDGDGENYDIAIYNANGEQIEYLHVMSNDIFNKEEFDLLKKHYESVTKTYYKVDETINSIIDELIKK